MYKISFSYSNTCTRKLREGIQKKSIKSLKEKKRKQNETKKPKNNIFNLQQLYIHTGDTLA